MHKIIVAILSVILISCVPATKFREVDKMKKECESEREALKIQNEKLTVDNNESKRRLSLLETQSKSLLKDSVDRIIKYNSLKKEHDRISLLYNELQESQDNLLKGNAKETSKLLKQLQTTQTELQQKEEDLKKAEISLNEKKRNLDLARAELDEKNAHIREMDRILFLKDSTVKALKNKVSDALIGFENEGLSVNIRNGKVYVSLDEKLLFKSGSYEVDAKGADALHKLAKVLEQNNDINVMIEGHTDDVSYKGKAELQDNWDLSVMRATSVVKIILKGSKIDPRRLTASGHGEFMPVDKTNSSQARQKNRRTEIILTPKLDELFKILDSN
jgi:chemotaxis protein MotB